MLALLFHRLMVSAACDSIHARFIALIHPAKTYAKRGVLVPGIGRGLGGRGMSSCAAGTLFLEVGHFSMGAPQRCNPCWTRL